MISSATPASADFAISTETVGSTAWREMVALRDQVLRAPLGLSFSDAQLAAEADQIHLAIRRAERLCGTVLLVRPDRDGEAKLRQMAISPDCQGQGLGTHLVRRAETELRRPGARRVRLAARLHAVGFYERLGYAAEGPVFIEVTLPHWLMRKRLDPEG